MIFDRYWLLKFLKKHPFVGLLLCLALMVFLTGPHMIEAGQLHGYFGSANLIQAPVTDKYTEDYFHRGRRSTECMVKALVNEQILPIRVDCAEWKTLQSGSRIDLVHTSLGLEAVSFRAPHFAIELALYIFEFLALLYFARLLVRQRHSVKDVTR